jgi:hypothetical protein
MSEPALRAVLVVAALAVVAGAVVVGRWLQRRRAGRLTLDLTGIEGRVILFSDTACARCDAVRDLLTDLGADFIEIAHGEGRFGEIGVDAVPLVVVRGRDGAVTAQIGGVPGSARLRRALRSGGIAAGE